jgi:hypothetical protein
MSKIYSFGVDEDSNVFDKEYKDFDDYYVNEGKDLVYNVLSDDSVEECYVNYEEEDEVILKELCIKYNRILKENNDYVLISYYVEYDNSYLIIKRDDLNLLVSCKEVEYM